MTSTWIGVWYVFRDNQQLHLYIYISNIVDIVGC